MKFCNKYSGSRGNMTIIRTPRNTVLVDCGGGASRILPALNSCGLSLADIDAILVTHEHSDHIGGMEVVLSANPKIKVYAHALCAPIVAEKLATNNKIISFDKPFCVDGFGVDFIPLSHDSVYCCGYKLTDDKGKSVALLTDTGDVDDEQVLHFFNGCDTVLLESNHDVKMVEQGSYPFLLKKRILGNKGHLSNIRAGQLVSRLPDFNVKNVFLGHISLDNNTEEIAFCESMNCLKNRGVTEGKDINLFVAKQFVGGKEINVE